MPQQRCIRDPTSAGPSVGRTRTIRTALDPQQINTAAGLAEQNLRVLETRPGRSTGSWTRSDMELLSDQLAAVHSCGSVYSSTSGRDGVRTRSDSDWPLSAPDVLSKFCWEPTGWTKNCFSLKNKELNGSDPFELDPDPVPPQVYLPDRRVQVGPDPAARSASLRCSSLSSPTSPVSPCSR